MTPEPEYVALTAEDWRYEAAKIIFLSVIVAGQVAISVMAYGTWGWLLGGAEAALWVSFAIYWTHALRTQGYEVVPPEKRSSLL